MFKVPNVSNMPNISQWTRYLAYIYALFPLSDYLIRHMLGLSTLAALWDKGLLFILAGSALLFHFDKTKWHALMHTLKWPLILWIGLGIAHLFLDLPNFAASFDGFRAVYFYMLAALIGLFLFDDEASSRRLLDLLLAVATLAAIVGIGQYIVGVDVPASWTDVSEKTSRRAFSFVVSPNVFGSYMALFTPIAAGLLLISKTSWGRLYYSISFFLLGAGLILSASRGAWLALALSALVTAFMLRRIYALALSSVFVLLTAIIPPIRRRILALISPTYWEKSGSDGRIARWTRAYHEMRFDPFFGKGLGHYGGATGQRYFGTTYVDSYYFKTLAETGLVGLGLLLYLLLTLLVALWQKTLSQRNRSTKILTISLVTGLTAVLLHNAVENIFEVPFMNAYFWLIVGLTFSMLWRGEDPAVRFTEDAPSKDTPSGHHQPPSPIQPSSQMQPPGQNHNMPPATQLKAKVNGHA